MQGTPTQALARLASENKAFIQLFQHGTLSVEIYKPNAVDKQQPHDRDEVYVIISGQGVFFHEGVRTSFNAGDFLFVPAGDEHRFEHFSEDFCTGVFFYGPVGGEQYS